MGDPNAVTKFAQRLKADYRIPGKVFFVNNSTVLAPGAVVGTDNTSVGQSELEPFSTVDFAIGQCTANRGDAIFVLGPHAETVTAAVTMDVAGVQIIGLPIGNRRPRITVNGAIDAVTITQANCAFRGFEMNIVTTDAATAFINVAAARCWIDDIYMIPSVTGLNVVDCITLASGADDLLISNVIIHNTVVDVNSFLSIEAAVARLEVRNCYWSGGVATAGIIDGATATQIWLHDITIRTVGTTIPCVTLDNNPTGTAERVTTLGTHTTLATNANWGNAMRLSNLWTCEETDASRQATNIIPALDTD